MDAAQRRSLQQHFDAWAADHGARREGHRYRTGGRLSYVAHLRVEHDGGLSFVHLAGAEFQPLGDVLLEAPAFVVGVAQVQDQLPGAIGRAMIPTDVGLVEVLVQDTRPADAPPLGRDVFNCMITPLSDWPDADQTPQPTTAPRGQSFFRR